MELAYEITKLYCGEDGAAAARRRFIDVFQRDLIPEDIEILYIGNEDNLEEMIDHHKRQGEMDPASVSAAAAHGSGGGPVVQDLENGRGARDVHLCRNI